MPGTAFSAARDAVHTLMLLALPVAGSAGHLRAQDARPTAPVAIAGIGIGAPSDSVVLLLTKHNPRWRIDSTMLVFTEEPTKQFAMSMGAREINGPRMKWDLIGAELSLPPGSPRVVRIQRRMQFVDGQRLPLTATIQALKNQYGSHAQSVTPSSLIWYFDADNRPATRPARCNGVSYDLDQGWATMQTVANVDVALLRLPQHAAYAAACGRFLVASWTVDLTNPELIGSIDLHFEDANLRVESLKNSGAYRQELIARIRAAEAEAARRRGVIDF